MTRPAIARTPVALGAALALAIAAGSAQGLPEDAELPMDIASGPGELLLDQGVVVLQGSADTPATITQGTRRIEGLEIRIQREAGVITRVTVTGTPARFRQVLNPGEEPVRISGSTLIYDNSGQMLTIEGDGLVEQAGMTARNSLFEYNLATGRIRAPENPDGEQMRLVIPPAQDAP